MRRCPWGDQMHPTDDPEGGPCSGCREWAKEELAAWEEDQMKAMQRGDDGAV